MGEYVFGFELKGLRDPYVTTGVNAQKPILFTDKAIDVAQLPAEFANYKILPIIEPGFDPGENWVGDPRGGLGKGGVQSILLPEDTGTTSAGALGKILLPDPKAPFWIVRNPVIEEDTVGNIDIYVNGRAGAGNAPQIGSMYWIEGEAFYAGNVVTLSTQSYRVVASRAHCGSYQERHEIDPAAYGESGEGKDYQMRLDSKPNFQGNRFKGAFYLWRMAAQRESVCTEIDRRYFYVDKPPMLIEKNGRFYYQIEPRPVPDVVEGYKFSATPKELPLTERVQVIAIEEISSAAGYICRPIKAKLTIPRQKAEQLFRHALHLPPSGNLYTPLLGDLWTRIQAARPMVDHRIVVTSLGAWVYTISNVDYITYGGRTKAEFYLDLVGYEQGATIAGEHPNGSPPTQGASGVGESGFARPPFESGWSWYPQTKVNLDEEAPTVALRWSFNCKPIEAALICLLSRGGATSGAYDKLLGRPLSMPLEWINLGATVVDELTIDPRTQEALQLNQLLDETIVPQFQGSDTVGSFLRDLCLFYLLLFAPKSNGRFMFVRWASTQPEGLEAINPSKESLDVGELLEPLQALNMLSGINEGDLSPQFGRSITLGGVKTVEALANAVPVRVWQPGNVLSDEALTSEAFTNFVRALFSVLGGQPRLFKVETSLADQQFDPGDVCQWTDKRIPTPEGIGFANVRFLVVGKDVNMRELTATYALLRDYYNETTTTEGKVAPCLLIDQVLHRTGNDVVVDVFSIGDPDFDIGASYDEIYQELVNDGGYVRIAYPLAHNPEATEADDRPGWLECYAVVSSVRQRGRVSRMTLTLDPSWVRGGFTSYDLIRRGARVYMTDRREDDQNVEGVLIEPNYRQLYSDGTGFDFAKWGNESTFDRNYTLITLTP